jgi:Uma2 family endonuclease
LYAKVGIPEAWLVDLQGRRLTVYRNPGTDAYGEILPVEDLSRVALPAPLDGAVDLSALF